MNCPPGFPRGEPSPAPPRTTRSDHVCGLGILAGILVLVYPAISLLTLAVVLGVWLLIYGVMEMALAFRLRSAGKVAARVVHAT
jgi:uncharacterized membrane protein HdeD (DUF308 family)